MAVIMNMCNERHNDHCNEHFHFFENRFVAALIGSVRSCTGDKPPTRTWSYMAAIP